MKIRSKHMSMLIAFLLAFAMVLIIPLSTLAATGDIGDIDNDGVLSQTDLDYLNGVLDGTQQSNVACDVNGDNMIDSDDVVVLKHLIDPENPALNDPDDLLFGAESDNLQALIARGDSTQALKIDAGNTAVVAFESALDWSERTILGMDVLLVGCDSLEFQVAVSTGVDTQTADVTVYADKGHWSTVYMELPSGCSNATGLEITVPEIDGVTVYLDQFKVYSSSVDIEYPETENVLASNGQSDYVVVIPADASLGERDAANRLVKHLNTATGTTLNIITDAEYVSGKALFIGNTVQTQNAGITVDATQLGLSGHIVKTIGENCYLVGATSSGNHFAVTTFLKNTVGYAMYDSNEVILIKTSEVKLRSFDGEPQLPSIEYRPLGSLANPRTEFRYANMVVDSGWLTPRDSDKAWHNSLDFLPPSEFADLSNMDSYHPAWYASDYREVCFTAHGDEVELEAMVDEVVNVIIAAAEAKPDTNRMTFTMQDASYWCDCDACVACEETYGAKTASCIILFNKIMDKVNAYMDANMDGRRITLYFFSYLVAQEAPMEWDEAANKWIPTSDDVVPHEGVGVMCAPLHADYAYPMNHPKNEAYYTVLQQWKDMGLPIAYWVYNLNFTSSFIPTNTFATDVANYPLFEDAGVVWLYNQGQWQNTALTAFNHLKEFLQAQLAWDAHCDTEELTDNYFEAQFKDAAPAMRQFYDALRQRLDYCTQTLGISGDIADSGMYTEAAFPEEIINGYMNYIHAALEAIEPMKSTDAEAYTLVYNRIIAESLFPRFYQITLYGDSYDSTTLTEMKLDFKADCETVGFKYSKEYVTIDNLWKEWGIGEVDLTSTGMQDVDLSAGNAISLTAEGLTGTIKGVSVDDGEMIAVNDGNISLSGSTLTADKAVWESLGLGEHTLYVHTAQSIYKLNITVATKVIASYNDLKAIANDLSGYYVMSADIDAAAEGYLEINNFAGTLDGRGHAVSNLKVYQGGLFNRMGAATIKNLVLLDVVNSHATNGAALAWIISGAKLENLVITSDNCVEVVEEMNTVPTATNCLVIMPQGKYFVNVSGLFAYDPSIYTNVYTVMGQASGDQPGLSNHIYQSTWNNCASYANINTLIDAGTVGPCSVVNDQVIYGDHLIAEAVTTEVDLTSTGMHDVDLSTGNTISLTAEGLTGTIKGISVDDGELITVNDGNMSLTDSTLTVSKTVWESFGLGEHTLYVYTTERNIYKLNITVVTKVITSYSDLQSITNDLSGYYILGADIDAEAEGYLEINNFAGTLDGRGHAVSNLHVYQGGLFMNLKAAAVKNLALLDVVTSHATNGAALAWFVTGTDLENLVITSDNCVKVVEEMNTVPTATNCLVIMPNGQHFVNVSGLFAHDPSIYTNVYTVMGQASGDQPGLSNHIYQSTWNSCVSYADINALIKAGTVGPCTVVDDQVLYGDHVIAENEKVEVDLTTTGMHDVDLSTGNTVSLTAEGLTGKLKGISVDSGDRIAANDGNMSLTGNTLTADKAVWESLGLGEHTLNVYTTENVYKLNITVVTDVITSYSDLKSITNNLSGYYVLSADIDAAAEGYLEINNFTGTLDGRGYAVSNLHVYQGGLFMNLKAAAVKNLALLDVVTSHATNGAALAWGVSGTDLEDLVITSDNCVKVVHELNTGATATNCLVIMAQGKYFVDVGSPWAASSAYTDIYTVMGNASGEKAGLCNGAYSSTWTNCASYADINALIEAGTVGPCTVVDDQVLYGDHLIAEIEKVEVDLTSTGMHDVDLSAGDVVSLTAEGLTGTIEGISVDDGEMIAVNDGNMSLAGNTLTADKAVWESLGLGEHTLYVHTTKNSYKLNITVATDVITSYNDLKSITNNLSGYYILGADIDAAAEACLEINNFTGTLDGRGHAVSNLHVYQGGLFMNLKAAAVKNLALLDVVNAHATNGAALAWTVSGTDLENLVITSDNCVEVVEEMNTVPSATNCVVIMSQGKYFVNVSGLFAHDPSIYTNVYTVMGQASGDQPGLSNHIYQSTWNYCASYSDTDALIQSGNVAPCTVVSGTLYYGDHVIAMVNHDLVVGEDAVIEATGMTGTLLGVSVDGGDMVAAADGNMSLANDQLTITSAVLQSFGMGEHTLYVHTSYKDYRLSITVATKVIATYNDLKSIANDLSGYYVMSADIDAAAEAYLEINNFTGTLDGRGHAVSNLKVWQAGLFNRMGAATVKNLALLNVENATTSGSVLAETISGAHLENLVITSDNCVKVVTELNTGATATNCIAILTNGNYFVNVGSPWAASSKYTNIYTVMGNASGNPAGLCGGAYSSTWTNCAHYADVATLLTNVQNGTVQVPDCTVENSTLYWNGISVCQAS